MTTKTKQNTLKKAKAFIKLLSRPDVKPSRLYKPKKHEKSFYERSVVEIKYKGYIEKQKKRNKKNKKTKQQKNTNKL